MACAGLQETQGAGIVTVKEDCEVVLKHELLEDYEAQVVNEPEVQHRFHEIYFDETAEWKSEDDDFDMNDPLCVQEDVVGGKIRGEVAVKSDLIDAGPKKVLPISAIGKNDTRECNVKCEPAIDDLESTSPIVSVTVTKEEECSLKIDSIDNDLEHTSSCICPISSVERQHIIKIEPNSIAEEPVLSITTTATQREHRVKTEPEVFDREDTPYDVNAASTTAMDRQCNVKTEPQGTDIQCTAFTRDTSERECSVDTDVNNVGLSTSPEMDWKSDTPLDIEEACIKVEEDDTWNVDEESIVLPRAEQVLVAGTAFPELSRLLELGHHGDTCHPDVHTLISGTYGEHNYAASGDACSKTCEQIFNHPSTNISGIHNVPAGKCTALQSEIRTPLSYNSSTETIMCKTELIHPTDNHQTEEQPLQYICKICHKVCKSKNTLHRHRKTCEMRMYRCGYCSNIFSTMANLDDHMRYHTGGRPYHCTDCGKGFKSNARLKYHMYIHTGEWPYPCTECGKRFRLNTELKIHMRSHTDERPYTCTKCGKGFKLNAQLKHHMYIHTGEWPYLCGECGKGFKCNAELKYHMNSHTRKCSYPYPCIECGKGFKSNAQLKYHMYIHTGKLPYPCSECGKGFKLNAELKFHLRSHTDERLNRKRGRLSN